MKKILLFLLLSALPLLLFGAGNRTVSVRGKVSGAWHPELAVCNGEKFFPVKKDGTFSFTYQQPEGTPFIYLAIPDQFQPGGQWKSIVKYGANTVSFKISPRKVRKGNFNIIHGSDIQFDVVREKAELEDLADSIAAVMKKENCDFITLPGDLTMNGDIPHLEAIKKAFDARKISYFEVIGGHDVIRSKPFKTSHFTQVFGAPYSSWNRNGIHFMAIVTESHILTPGEQKRHLEWIKNDLSRLAPGMPVVLVAHTPDNKQYFKYLQLNKRKFHAFLGAHYHFDNLFARKGAVNIYNTPLRTVEAGSLTRKLRIVTLSADGGVKETRSRFLGCRYFIKGFSAADGIAKIQIYDTNSPVSAAWIESGDSKIPLARKNEFFWEAPLNKQKKVTVGALFANGHTEKKELDLTPDKKIKWACTADGLFLHRPEVTYHNGKVYVHTTSGNFPGKGGITALDAATGKKLWHTPLPGNIGAKVACWKEQLFAVSTSGIFYVLNAASGKVIYKRDLVLYADPNRLVRCPMPPAVTSKGKVLIQGTGIMTALYDAVTRKVTYLPQLRAVQIFHAFAAEGDLIALTSPFPTLFDAEKKKIIWQVKAKMSFGSQVAPVFDKEAIYFMLQNQLLKINRKTGKLLWRKAAPGRRQEMGGLTKSGDKLILSSGGRVIIFNAATGNREGGMITLPCRKENFRKPANQAGITLYQGKILIPTDMGGIQLFDPVSRKSRILTDPGVSFQGAAATNGKEIFVSSAQGMIFAISE